MIYLKIQTDTIVKYRIIKMHDCVDCIQSCDVLEKIDHHSWTCIFTKYVEGEKTHSVRFGAFVSLLIILHSFSVKRTPDSDMKHEHDFLNFRNVRYFSP